MKNYIVFCKQKTAYEMRISDWSSDVCSSDLQRFTALAAAWVMQDAVFHLMKPHGELLIVAIPDLQENSGSASIRTRLSTMCALKPMPKQDARFFGDALAGRSEERRVGKECVSTCRYRWSRYHKKKNKKKKTQ